MKLSFAKTLFTTVLMAACLQMQSVAASEDGGRTMKKITQTAGRDALGQFAPEFAHFNDDILFGENWNNQDLTLKVRSLITVVALVSSGITDSSLKYHLTNAKNNGVTRKEIVAALTHIGFYAGWPKAWAAFNMAKEIWSEKEQSGKASLPAELQEHQDTMIFSVGAPNDAYARYFTGKSYLAPVSKDQVGIYNVTFEPSRRIFFSPCS